MLEAFTLTFETKMEVDKRLRMKRKEIDQVNEEFSDFSLSSPARKIRRLFHQDVDLPPIMEENEIDMEMQETAEEVVESAPINEERSIVLFNPLNYHTSPSGNLFVDRSLISGIKNRCLRDASLANDTQNKDHTSNKCQAVVCWNPAQFPCSSQSERTFQKPRTLEITELDESGEDVVMDDVAMEIEEDSRSTGLSFHQQEQLQEEPTLGFGLHQWQQQQNYIVPQFPQVTTTPITWFR